MKNLAACLVLLCAAAAAPAVHGQGGSKPPEQPPTVSSVLNTLYGVVEQQVVSAAEAMPEDKYSFAPTNGEFKGVRTFAQQIKHVAAVNYELGAALLDQKPPVDIGEEAGPASITSKEDVLKFLKESFSYVHKAIATINEQNLVGTVKSPFGEGWVTRLSLATTVAWHGFDHYGQMVEYLRMNGIVPPASR